VRGLLAAIAARADDDVGLTARHRHRRQYQRAGDRTAAGGHAGEEAQVRNAHAVDELELVDVLDVETGDAVDVGDRQPGVVEPPGSPSPLDAVR
jgi:hypothetical protein